jgi:hypothetical protein
MAKDTKDNKDLPVTADEKRASDIAGDDEIQFFDTTIAKLVPRENEETGETEWVEVLSDNLYPGEKLKRVADEEKAAEKAKKDEDDGKNAPSTPNAAPASN